MADTDNNKFKVIKKDNTDRIENTPFIEQFEWEATKYEPGNNLRNALLVLKNKSSDPIITQLKIIGDCIVFDITTKPSACLKLTDGTTMQKFKIDQSVIDQAPVWSSLIRPYLEFFGITNFELEEHKCLVNSGKISKTSPHFKWMVEFLLKNSSWIKNDLLEHLDKVTLLLKKDVPTVGESKSDNKDDESKDADKVYDRLLNSLLFSSNPQLGIIKL